MSEELIYLLIGGLLGYGGSLLQHIFALRQHKRDEIWKEKIRIYSKVIEELGKSFLDLETYPQAYFDPILKTKFALRLGSILAPARLVASDKLEEKLRDLYEEETAWFNTFSNKNLTNEDNEEIANRSLKYRYIVEQEMRKELKA